MTTTIMVDPGVSRGKADARIVCRYLAFAAQIWGRPDLSDMTQTADAPADLAREEDRRLEREHHAVSASRGVGGDRELADLDGEGAG